MAKNIKNKNAKRSVETGRTELPPEKNYLWLTGILAITFIVFIPAIRNQFVTFDDPHYVFENPYIKGFSSENLKTIFFEDANNLGNYHPLTLFSYVFNYSFSGLNPTAFHLTNILLHLFNTFIVFQLALLLFARFGSAHRQLLSSITALLFGIHPLHVESVAWISGRKDLLYTCFYLLSLLSYIRYLGKKELKYYLLSLLFFILSLLSKGMAVTLSLSVVAIDYVFKRDLLHKKVILEKIPFFLLSIIFGVIAILVQQAQGATEIIKFSFFDRIIFASFGFTQYLIKFVFPYKLCGYYPYPDQFSAVIPTVYYFSLLPVLLAGGWLLYFILVRPDRKIVFGILFFIINVMFVLQLFPVGSAVMADRYTYLSSFGIFFLMAAGFGYLLRKFNSFRIVLFSILFIYVSVLSVISFQRIAVWRDSFSFWNDVMLKYPYFYPAINNLGELNETDGKIQEAFSLFEKSIKANQRNPNAYFHRGSIYGKSGKLKEAISDFSEAIRYSPGFTQAYINRAIAKAMNHDNRGALSDLDSVLAKGKNESAYFNRGILRNELKEYPQAILDFQEAINLNASCLKCYYSMGLANYHARLFRQAIKSFSTCIEMNPVSGNAYYYRALSYKETGSRDSCCNDLQKAVNLGMKEAEPSLEQYCR
jgi:protein O-mannosyl-transferase